MMDCPDCKVDEYKTALEEIGNLSFQVTIVDFPNEDYLTQDYKDLQIHYRSMQKEILNIINKAKGGVDEKN